MTDIVWRIYNPDAYPGSMKPHTTFMPPWAEAEGNAESVAGDLVEDFFRIEREWLEWFGDEISVDVMVEIISPREIAGHYAVDLERVPKARARRAAAP